jgi:glutaryl-CoA dehydrogenase
MAAPAVCTGATTAPPPTTRSAGDARFNRRETSGQRHPLLLERHIGRHLTDMEVVSTYEGTDSMQALIVGRDITGLCAFTRSRRS